MFLLYVDESGDTGHAAGASPCFVLSGLVLHELRWHATLEAIIDFRKELRARRGLKLREEIHSKAFIHKPGELDRAAAILAVAASPDQNRFLRTIAGAVTAIAGELDFRLE